MLAGRRFATWRFSWRWLGNAMRSLLVSFAALAATLWILPGEQVPDGGAETIATLVLTVLAVGAVVRPFLTLLTVLLGSIGLLVVGLLAQSVVLGVALALVPGIQPLAVPETLLAALLVSLVAAALNWVVDSSTEEVFFAQVLGRAVRVARQHDVSGPGLLVVQLDGVAEPLLRQASAAGAIPAITRMIRDDGYRLRHWHTGLPSTTPAGQAVLLHGQATAIPAFRWWDKDRGRLLECSRAGDAAEAEADFTDGRGLLADGGFSVANLFSGDAPEQALTMSRPRVLKERGAAAFVTSRTGFLRALVLLAGQIVTEWHQGRRQRRRNVEPRVSRTGAFLFLRGLTTVVLRDLSVAIVAEQMARGVPVIYVDLLDYDEVAHHAGPTRPESMRTLEGMDRVVQFFAELTEEVGRDYELVVVSDHGQTQGSTFAQREGRTLSEAVRELVDCPTVEEEHRAPAELLAPVNLLQAEGRRAPLGPRTGRRRESGSPDADPPADPREVTRVRVVASGSIAHLYLVDVPGRLAREDVEALTPRLLPGLLALAHVGLVVTRRGDGVLVVEGAGGRRLLGGPLGPQTSQVEGADPLAAYGKHAAADLLALDEKWHVGDVVVLGRWDPALREVAAFEELVGSHGGLGGWQSDAMLVHPGHWEVPEGPLDGLGVHRLLVGRLRQLGLRSDPELELERA
ncbi:hypothetical protein D9V37_01490 [Nocardioides mangrovicus]|uniref:Phosphodiesterase n=1 Tax=Nocardioides mangrovicus TaxID=2478913 RepID=A0A3L8P638_9ACTN|nr:hypothetical protein D9V37_01490 [Nocardioides mangrovicus]